MALVYEDLGVHPLFPTARAVICYDSDGCGRVFLYRGYRDSRCYMKLYPDDAETYRFSGKRVIRIDRLRKKRITPADKGEAAGVIRTRDVRACQ